MIKRYYAYSVKAGDGQYNGVCSHVSFFNQGIKAYEFLKEDAAEKLCAEKKDIMLVFFNRI